MSLLTHSATRVSIVLVFLTLFYAALFQKDLPYNLDDSWSLSFSYNLCNQNIQTDQMWRVRYPNGMDGTHLFGKFAAYTQCAVLQRSGWLPRAAESINIAFTIASLAVWWAALRSLGFDSKFATYFILLLGVARPTVLMTETSRYEFFVFFLLASAFWLTAKRFEFAACLVAMLAVETEPAAVFVVLFIGVMLVARSDSRPMLALKALVASLIAIATYFMMHPDSIQILKGGAGLQQHYVPGQFFYEYFLKDTHHLPYLVLFVIGNALYFIHRKKNVKLPLAIASLLLLLFFIIFPHPNPYYLALTYPCWLLGALIGFEYAPRLKWIPIAVSILSLLTYPHRVHMNWNQGYSAADLANVAQMIRQGEERWHLDDAKTTIVGDWSLWFVHPAHYLSSSMLPSSGIPQGELYLCYQEPLSADDPLVMKTCRDAWDQSTLAQVASMPMKGRTLSLYRRVTP